MSRDRNLILTLSAAWAVLCLLAGARPAAAGDEPFNRSLIAITLAEKDLLPESVAHDPRSGAFFVSSTRKGKVVRVAADGAVSDFIAPRAHGLYMTIGMKADPARRALWVASSYGSNLEDHAPRQGNPAGLFRFDLDSGALTGRWLLDDQGATHFLNDLVVAPDGSVFVTHMFDAAQVWRLDAATGTFAPWYRGDATFRYPNGITCAGACKHLFVAHEGGISRIDVAAKERTALATPPGWSLGGVDGLYLHRGALVAIMPAKRKVARFTLDAQAAAVTAAETLEYKHPLFDTPTTGVIVDGWLHYIANAQFDRFDAAGKLFPLERLYQPVILKLPLDR